MDYPTLLTDLQWTPRQDGPAINKMILYFLKNSDADLWDSGTLRGTHYPVESILLWLWFFGLYTLDCRC